MTTPPLPAHDGAAPVGRDEVVAATLAAAAELFAERGPAATSIRDIATRSRVNHGLVYRHFGTKERLVGAVLDQVFQKMTSPTRDDFMKELRSVKDYVAPLMLDGSSVDTTVDGQPAVSSVTVQKYNGKGYAPATSWE